MRCVMFVPVLALAAMPAFAARTCDDVKADVAAKIDRKGVKKYTLEVVRKGEEGDRRVVGTCEGGRKILVYKRGKAA